MKPTTTTTAATIKHWISLNLFCSTADVWLTGNVVVVRIVFFCYFVAKEEEDDEKTTTNILTLKHEHWLKHENTKNKCKKTNQIKYKIKKKYSVGPNSFKAYTIKERKDL